MQKPDLNKELNVFLGLLHSEKEPDGNIYENYLFGGDLDDLEQEIAKVTKRNGDLSIIYSAPESEQSTQRESSSLNDLFHAIHRDLVYGQKTQKWELIKECEGRVKALQKCINLHLSKAQNSIREFQEKSNATETSNKLLIEALTSAQSEIAILQKKVKQQGDEPVGKLKQMVAELRKQNEELNRRNQSLQQSNERITQQLEDQARRFMQNEDEFRDVSNRLIKSNQALREIIVNMGNISPLNKKKLQDVIKYLTNDKDKERGRCASKPRSKATETSRSKENNYCSASSQRMKSHSPTPMYNSTRKILASTNEAQNLSHSKINILDTNYQTSYKELFLKSLMGSKIQK